MEPAKAAADDHRRDVLEPAEAEQRRLRDAAATAAKEANSAFQQKREAEHAVDRLLYVGPEDPLRPEVIR